MTNIKDRISLLVVELDYVEKMYEKSFEVIKKSEKEFAKKLKELDDPNLEVVNSPNRDSQNNDKKNKEKKNKEAELKKKEKENTVFNKKTPDKYKKLFRKIVTVTHPDKHSNDISDQTKFFYLSIYHQLIESFEEEKYHNILIFAEKLEIDYKYEDFIDEMDKLTKEKNKKEMEIGKFKKNPIWEFYMSTNEVEKDIIFKKIVKMLKKNNQ